jgi:hypothetical protein
MELAKTNVREAMRKEVEVNQQLIDKSAVHRNSPRYYKIAVFTVMTRNNTLRHFLNLDDSKQSPFNLKSSVPMSEEYKNLIYKTSATKYALNVKTEAENQLFLDYTHVDYKRNRYFLDEILPEQPRSSKLWQKFWDILGSVIIVCFRFWWVPLAIWVAFSIWKYEDSSASSGSSSRNYQAASTRNGNTFGAGGVKGGNSDNKSASNIPQVKDNSKQADFGNGGKSGHDSAGSVEADKQNVATSKSISERTLPSDKTYNLIAEYYLPYWYGIVFFDINNAESASVLSGRIIVMDFKLPPDSGAIYKVNGNEIKGAAVTFESNYTWFKFVANKGENIVTVDYNGFSYNYTFQAF